MLIAYVFSIFGTVNMCLSGVYAPIFGTVNMCLSGVYAVLGGNYSCTHNIINTYPVFTERLKN